MFDIYGIGIKKGGVPNDFIGEMMQYLWIHAYMSRDADLVYYSTMTSNSLADMEEWTFSEFKRREVIMRKAVEQKLRL